MSRDDALDTLIAREAIRDLVALYNFHGDRGEVDAVAALFTDDGVLDVVMGGEPRVASGRAEIAELLASVAAGWAPDSPEAPPRWVRHFVSTQVIYLESPTRATASAYVLVMRPHGVESVARYLDTFVLQDGFWQFERRKARRDTSMDDPPRG